MQYHDTIIAESGKMKQRFHKVDRSNAYKVHVDAEKERNN